MKVTDKPADTDTPGTYTVKYTATNSKGTANASLKVHILYKPAALSQTAAARVTNTNNFTLTATMLQTGGVNWTETGFVYGALQNPTVTLNDGSVKTASAVNTKNGSIKASVTGLTEGITYYARAYAKAADGTIIYGNQSAGFGLNAPNYGTFQVTNSGSNTFTVSRTGGTDGAQIVYYRTVNGSAVGDTHFTHAAGSVKFAKGESSKTVTVTEKTANTAYYTNDITAHTNADRTYQLEIYRVEGGATIDGNKAKATRTMTKSSSYTISRNVYKEQARSVTITDNNKWVADHSGTGNWKIYFKNDRKKNTDQLNFNVQRSLDASDLSIAYLKKTAKNLLYRAHFTYREDEDGYQLVWMGPEAPGYGPLEIGSKKCIDMNTSLGCAYFTATWETNDSKTAAMFLPAMSGSEIKAVNDFINRYIAEINGKKYVEFGIDDTVHVWFSSAGADKDIWHMESYTDYIKVHDVNEPQLIAIAPMAGGKYLQGDSVTVSLIFDEIVDSTNSSLSSSSTITTNWGTFKYAGGADTNVLYFTGTVPANAGSPIKLSTLDCASQIKDMCDDTGKVSGFITEKSANVTVGTVAAPTVSIGTITNASGVLTGKITATNAKKLEYVWTDSKTVPASGWRMLSNTKSSTVTIRQTSGTWYLHARATNSDGKVVTTYRSVTVPASGTGAPVNADLTVSADNSSWAKTRSITVMRSPANATVTVKTPAGNIETVTGSSYKATANGVYNFTLTYNGETVTRQAAVSRLDNTAPTIEINDLNNLTHADQVTLTFSVTDGGSGVENVTAKWGSSSAALTNNGDGTYTTTCPNTTGNWKLNVTAADGVGNSSSKVSATYTVKLDKPVLTVTKTGETKQGVSYKYSVNAKGNKDVTVYLPDGTQTDKLTGSFTLTETGSYTIAVTDRAGHFVSKELDVTASVDGVAPEVRLYADDSNASDELTVEVVVYEESGMPTVKQGGSALTMTADSEETGSYTGSFTVTKGGVYTVTATDAAGNTDDGSITVYALINGDNTTLKLPEADGTYGVLPTPESRTGYTFDGWYTAEAGGTKADSSMEATAYSLYARWTPFTYKVTLIGDGGTGTNLTSYTYGEGAVLPADWTKQCAELDGWYTAETGGTKIDKIGADEYGDKTYYARWTPAHTWVDATCTAPKTCSVCNITEGKALGHEYETTWSNDADKHWHKCSRCSDKTDEAPHLWDDGKVTAEPGCTTAGTKTFSCICGATKTENINAKGHTAGAAVKENEIPATCTSGGSYEEVIYCTVCKAEISRTQKTTPAAGHSFGEWKTVQEATCTAEGREERVCSACRDKQAKGIAKIPHTESDWIKDKDGHWKECTACAAIVAAKAEHTFGEWITDTPATEDKEGLKHRVCKVCEYSEETAIPKLEHTHKLTRVDAVAADCENGGSIEYYTCTCGKWFGDANAENEINDHDSVNKPALGHDFTVKQHDENQHWYKCSRCDDKKDGAAHEWDEGLITTPPTCTTAGTRTFICNVCSEKKTETIKAKGHTKGNVVKENEIAANCTSGGSYDEVVYCTDCREELSREKKTVDALGHDRIHHDAKAATCTEKGWEAYDTCSRCDYTTYKETPAAGHSFGEWKTVQKATCTAEGREERVCSACSDKEAKGIARIPHTESGWIKDENNHWKKCTVCDVIVADKAEHTFGGWITDIPATEDAAGRRHQECGICGYINTETIPELGHTHRYDSEVTDEKYLKSEATCTAPAVYYKSCKCGEKGTETFTVGDSLGHDFTVLQHDENQHWYKCSRCDDKKDGAAHEWDEGLITTPPTCTTAGTRTFICNVCSEKKTETIKAKGHTKGNVVKENEIAANCTSGGSYDEVVYCTDCREELSREKKTVDALGHDRIHHDAKAATCTEKGWEAYDTCSRCDYTTYKETPAAGHSFELEKADEKYLKSEAACAAPAVYYKSCKCGEKGTDTFEYGTVNPDNHTGGTEIRNASEANHALQTKGYTGDTYCRGCNTKLGSGTEILPGDHTPDSVWKMNENNHWKECSISGCGAVIENTSGAHVYDGDGDADCNICGYTRTIIPIHKHSLEKVSAVAATCTSTGNTEHYKCEDCGKLFSDPAGTKEITAESVITGMLPHSPKELPAVEATCENTGLSAGSKCENCGTIIIEQTVIAARGHDFISGMWKYDTAQHWKKCSRCDMTDAKAAHVYEDDSDASCNVCGYNRNIAPAHTHDWAAAWSHDNTYHWHECLNSDCDVTDNMHKAGYAAHTEAAAVRENDEAADCEKDGSYEEVIYCTECNAEISRTKNIVKASGHDWGNWVVTKPATSSEDGEEQRVCRRDSSHVETKILPAITHTHQYSEAVKDDCIKSAATCTEPAVYYKSCECGAMSTETFIYGDALGHEFKWEHDDAQHWERCSRCYAAETTADHVYDNEQDVSCDICGYMRTVTPAHTHDWAAAWSYDNACHWHECLNSGCDVTENSSKYGYAAHVPGAAATETEPQICTECGYIIQAAQEHTHNLTKVTGTPATCTDGGTKDCWMCDGCGKMFEDEQGTAVITDINIPAKGHRWDNGVITTAPTASAEGVKTYTCEVCRATKTEALAKLPSGGGTVAPPKTDTITAEVTGDKSSVKITAEISGNTASVAEIGKNDIDKAGAGVDITIDLTVIPNEVTSVTVTKKSLENIYDSETDNVSVKFTETTVNMDRDTLKNIIDQMKGSDLKLVVDKHQEALKSMNNAQMDTVKGMKNPKIMDAYFVSGGVRITDFKGGGVDIAVPYPDKKGVNAWYIDDNGNKEKVPVKYDGKTVVITVSHFSHYVLEEDGGEIVEPVKPVPSVKSPDRVIYVKSVKYTKKNGTKITFNKVSGADGYYVYGNRCNTDKVYKFKKLATLKGNDNTVFVHKGTAKNTFYKYYIKAYKAVDGKRVTISRSQEIHFVNDVKGYRYGNPTKVTLSVKKRTLSRGKTFNLKNRVKVYSSKKVLLHVDKVRYVSSDSSIAKVNSKGKITAKKAGSCNIYAIAQNGKAAKIAVTVK